MCGAVQIEEMTIRPYKIAIRQMNNNQPTPRVAAMHRNYERTNGSAAVPVLGFRGCIIQGDSSAFLRGTVFGDSETGLELSLYCSHPFHRRRTRIGRIACDGKKTTSQSRTKTHKFVGTATVYSIHKEIML